MSSALKFVIQTNLDKNLLIKFRLLRQLLQKHGYTEEQITNMTKEPTEIWVAFNDVKKEFENIYETLIKYGLIESMVRLVLPNEVSEYIAKKLETIEGEIPLKKSKGNIQESVKYNKIENIIKDKLNNDSFEKNYIEDHTIYWDGNTDINESVEAVWEVSSVEIEPADEQGCDLIIHMVINFNRDHSFVYYENVGEDSDPMADPRRVRIGHPQDVSWIIDRLNTKVKNRMNREFPFNESCIKLYFE